MPVFAMNDLMIGYWGYWTIVGNTLSVQPCDLQEHLASCAYIIPRLM